MTDSLTIATEALRKIAALDRGNRYGSGTTDRLVLGLNEAGDIARTALTKIEERRTP